MSSFYSRSGKGGTGLYFVTTVVMSHICICILIAYSFGVNAVSQTRKNIPCHSRNGFVNENMTMPCTRRHPSLRGRYPLNDWWLTCPVTKTFGVNVQAGKKQLQGSTTVDGWNPAITTWDIKNTVNNGISYQPQLVSRISEPSTVGILMHLPEPLC